MIIGIYLKKLEYQRAVWRARILEARALAESESASSSSADFSMAGPLDTTENGPAPHAWPMRVIVLAWRLTASRERQGFVADSD